MLKTALLYDLRLATDALADEHPMSADRLIQLAGIIVADYEMCEEIVIQMEKVQRAIEEMVDD